MQSVREDGATRQMVHDSHHEPDGTVIVVPCLELYAKNDKNIEEENHFVYEILP